MKVGPPILRVKDLRKELSFYENFLGLDVGRRETTDDYLETIELVFKEKFKEYEGPLLILKHDPKAKEISHGFAGLSLCDTGSRQKSLAAAYTALSNSGVEFDGFADHLVSESLYLHDHERNGIEIYRDRPQNEWPRNQEGRIVMDTLPLDLGSLLNASKGEEKAGAGPFLNGAKIGHIHLRVTNLERSLRFYQDKLGLKMMTADWTPFGAGFLAAGNYHHHVGMNVWNSLNGKAHVNGELGLDLFTIILPDGSSLGNLASELGPALMKKDRAELLVSDPDGVRILIKSSMTGAAH